MYPINEFDKTRGFQKLYRELMFDVWRSGYEEQSMYDMDPEYLEWNYLADEDVIYTACDNDRIIGYIAAVPRRIRLQSEEMDSYLGYLFSVHQEYQRQGIGYSLFKKRVDSILEEKGCPLFFIYQDAGHSSTKLLEKFISREPYAAKKLCSFNMFTKILDLRTAHACDPFKWYERPILLKPFRALLERIPKVKTVEGTIRPYTENDGKACRALLNRYHKKKGMQLGTIWNDPKLFNKRMKYSDRVQCLVYEKEGEILGLFNWYYMTLRGKTDMRIAIPDNIYLDGLNRKEQQALVCGYLHRIREAGCGASVSFNIKYYPRGAFFRQGFIPYSRKIHLIAIGKPETIDKLDTLSAKEIYFDQR